jgi:hypothetical protein
MVAYVIVGGWQQAGLRQVRDHVVAASGDHLSSVILRCLAGGAQRTMQMVEQSGECRDVNVPRYGPIRGGCADPDNPAYYPVLSLEDAARRYPNTAAVINSDCGAGTQGSPGEFRGHGPEGLTVVRGDRLDGPANGDVNNAVRRPWLAVSRDAPLRAELGQWTSDDSSS